MICLKETLHWSRGAREREQNNQKSHGQHITHIQMRIFRLADTHTHTRTYNLFIISERVNVASQGKYGDCSTFIASNIAMHRNSNSCRHAITITNSYVYRLCWTCLLSWLFFFQTKIQANHHAYFQQQLRLLIINDNFAVNNAYICNASEFIAVEMSTTVPN